MPSSHTRLARQFSGIGIGNTALGVPIPRVWREVSDRTAFDPAATVRERIQPRARTRSPGSAVLILPLHLTACAGVQIIAGSWYAFQPPNLRDSALVVGSL
jgi:hypothetical protein